MRVTTETGYAELTEPAPGCLHCRYGGSVEVELFRPIREAMDERLVHHPRLVMFSDTTGISAYDPVAREWWTEWLQPHSKRVHLHVLVSSAMVHMALSMVALAMRGSVTSYKSRERFDEALRVAVAEARERQPRDSTV